MATTYYNCPVLIGESPLDNTYFFVAQQASIEESIPLLPIKSLGQSSVVNTVAENSLQGTISISYMLSAGTAGATAYDSVSIAEALSWSTINSTTPTLLAGSIGTTKFQNAVLTSFSVDASAQSVITCSMGLAYYKQSEALTAGGSSDETLLDDTSLAYAHGASSTPTATELALNNNLFSFKLDLSESVTPVKILGDVDPEMLLKGGGEVTMTWVGNNLPTGLLATDDADTLCITGRTTSFQATSCDGALLNETVTLPLTSKGKEEAYITSRSIDVSEGNVLNGTAVLTQYY